MTCFSPGHRGNVDGTGDGTHSPMSDINALLLVTMWKQKFTVFSVASSA